MAQWVECLLCKGEDPSSIPRTCVLKKPAMYSREVKTGGSFSFAGHPRPLTNSGLVRDGASEKAS